MKKRKVDPWFPFWVDKWLFGSTRIELEPDERGVFVDLLSLSKKDSGYIRANEGVPYLESQLCGLLNIEPELYHRTVKKCIKYGKTNRLKDGTLYMTSYEIYSLSDRQERRIEREMADSEDAMSEKPDTKNILNKKKQKEKNIKEEYTPEFESFWKEYPRKEGKEDTFITWKNLTKKIQAEIIQASPNYADAMRVEGRDKQYCWKPKTFINAKARRWKDYLEPIEKPRQVGESTYKPTDKEKERQKSIEAYRAELLKKYKPEIDKAKRAKDFDRLNDIENTINTEVAQRSQED